MARRLTCSGERLPMVRLALEKKSCLRTSGPRLADGQAVAHFVQQHFGCRPQEFFLCCMLSSAFEVISVQEIALGGIAATPADPRVIFSGALLSGAPAIILVHNHPSGVAEPSQDDVALTARMVEAGKLLRIQVFDHVIVGSGGAYFSFNERGVMPK